MHARDSTGEDERCRRRSNTFTRRAIPIPSSPRSSETAPSSSRGSCRVEVVDRVNDEVGTALDAADPDEELFNPILSEFHGRFTKQVSGVPGISPTFAVDVMCSPFLLGVCDRVLLPSCARYQLNIGHLLQRGPGAEDQWLHRDEAVWSDVPRPHPELQLASVIAFVDFTRANGATRLVPGSHRWRDRELAPAEQMMQPPPEPGQIAYAEMPAGSAVVYLGSTIHGGGANVTDVPAARCAPQLLPGLVAHRGEQLSRGPAVGRGEAPAPGAGAPRLCGARQHPPRWRLPRDGAHAGPGRSVGPRGTRILTAAPHRSRSVGQCDPSTSKASRSATAATIRSVFATVIAVP